MGLGQRRTAAVPAAQGVPAPSAAPKDPRRRAGAALIALVLLGLVGTGWPRPATTTQLTPSTGTKAALEGPPPDAAPDEQFWRPAVSAAADGPVIEPPISSSAVLPVLAATDPRLDLTGIPLRVLEAYRAAANRLAVEQPGCGLPWSLLAGIGRVESGHGTFGGAAVAADGRVLPEIIGVRLDGAGPVAMILDTDGGAYDRDPLFDRAVGPMQFIPSTWARYGADADGDGRNDPHDIDDVALGAGRYLCSAGGGSLTDATAMVNAVYAYNRSYDYVRLVLTLAAGYASATPESFGVNLLPPPSPVVTGPPLPPPGEAPAPVLAAILPAPGADSPTPVAAVIDDPSPEPSPAPTPEATPEPTPTSEPTPTPTPTPEPTPEPTPTPAPAPAPAPAPEPTPEPTPTATLEPTPEPSPSPSEPPVAVEPSPSPSPTEISPQPQPSP